MAKRPEFLGEEKTIEKDKTVYEVTVQT